MPSLGYIKWNKKLFLFIFCFFLSCDDGEICTHKPPRKNNNIIQEPVAISENNSDEKIGKLSNEVDFLKRVTTFSMRIKIHDEKLSPTSPSTCLGNL